MRKLVALLSGLRDELLLAIGEAERGEQIAAADRLEAAVIDMREKLPDAIEEAA